MQKLVPKKKNKPAPAQTSDLFSPAEGFTNPKHIFSVSEITRDIKSVLESTFGEIWVEGEVSNFAAHTSGHFYFTLKDDSAVLPAVMFSRANKDIKFKLENGLKIICFGKISAYAPRGSYQVIVEKIEPKGIGSLQLALEQLKAKLEKEGLFALERKRAIPYLPQRIGVVTSSTGAAIKDILKVLDQRFSDVQIIINPVQVQGEGAKEEISIAIKDLNLFNDGLPGHERIEVMIVGRGGGSIEDLWAFNEEIVARSIYSSKIPVISAVGHERDWTIADLVADVRAATPSVAAELVIPKKDDLREKVYNFTQDLKATFTDYALNFQNSLDDFMRRLGLSMENIFKSNVSALESTQKKLSLLSPVALVQQHKARMLDLARQVAIRAEHFLKLKQAEFRGAVEKLSSLSPLNILSRGYSITFKMPEGEILKDARLVKVGGNIKTRLPQGEILSQVTEVKHNG